jgi:Tol biopolymer transport system component
VMVVRADGTQPRVVARGLPAENSSSPSWSPDGRHIVFAVRREFEDYTGHELLVAALDGSRPRPIVIPELPAEAFLEIYGVDWTARAGSS